MFESCRAHIAAVLAGRHQPGTVRDGRCHDLAVRIVRIVRNAYGQQGADELIGIPYAYSVK
jgi:hypothetical protein